MTSQEQNYEIAKKQKETGDQAFKEGDVKAGWFKFLEPLTDVDDDKCWLLPQRWLRIMG